MTDGTRAEDEALALMRADGFGRSHVPNLHARLIAERDAALARAEAAEKYAETLEAIGFGQADQLSVFQNRIWELERRLAADDTQPQSDVDRVIDQLHRRVIGAPERTKLRGALDKADKPDTSRTGQDAAVGRALRIASVDELSAKIQKMVAAASARETR